MTFGEWWKSKRFINAEAYDYAEEARRSAYAKGVSDGYVAGRRDTDDAE
jgi:hypothetical protein